MKLSSLLEVLWAATLTNRVESRFKSRGGIFLVAPPGSLKTSMLGILETQHGVNFYSDMVSNDLSEAKALIVSNKVHCLVYTDFQKIFERRSDTAANVIGNIRALVDEGFTETTAERMKTAGHSLQTKARALVLGAMTEACYNDQIADWVRSGFARRFLFCHYVLKHPEMVTEAILGNNPIEFSWRAARVPANASIPLNVSEADRQFLRSCVKYQKGDDVTLVLLMKILSVLRWRVEILNLPKDDSREILLDFRESLGNSGAELLL